jgi:mono/diheme cytochrome c family protein
MRRRLKWALVSTLFTAVCALAAGIAFLCWAHGFSARDEPPALEKSLARRLRALAYPADVRRQANPVPLSPGVLSEARAHFADHCASCHGNDGRGQTEMGQHLYPRAPDMTRAETQSMTDGEVFHAIKYGVRLTGMPAWGAETSKDDDLASWKLVHFIRHLPQVTKSELEEMEKLNPRSPDELMTAQEEDRFLEG